MLVEYDHAEILQANRSGSKVRENAGNATIFLTHLGEVGGSEDASNTLLSENSVLGSLDTSVEYYTTLCLIV
jgi:hypothetical protein